MKYMIWNNKGGVGKTFLTYLLSSEYAIKHPDTDVVVADLCPQANVSEMLLGGNGKGEENLNTCYNNQRTIASYIKSRYDKSRFGKMGDESEYFVQVCKYNKEMPSNLYLLPGDTDLDICSTIINYMATAPEKGAWVKSRTFLADLLESFEIAHKNTAKRIYFFDCNPSFANYTEMAVIAAERIIVPCTADAASLRGIRNLLRLIYGINTSPLTSAAGDNVFDTFNSKCSDAGIKHPQIHLFIQNKSRVLDSKATRAYKAHSEEVERIVADTKKNRGENFTDNNRTVLNLKDGNTLASIVNHTGLPLSKVRAQKYDIYGKTTQADQGQINALTQDLNECLSVL